MASRMKMLVNYLMAQLTPWAEGKNQGFLLTLGPSDIHQGLNFHDDEIASSMSKYDEFSADLNPIGGFNQFDLV